uniref:Uncharacterized protein n=1 Tax=Rhodopseudomonas palustris (strain BisA53) TaxID=316055 RepID=Q07SV1_RHOP5
MSKQGDQFCFPEHIQAQTAKLLAALKADNHLEGFQPLNLENLDPDAMLNAIVASFDGDQTELVQGITGLIS